MLACCLLLLGIITLSRSTVIVTTAFSPPPFKFVPKSPIITTSTSHLALNVNTDPNNDHNHHQHYRNILILSHSVSQDVADGYFDVNTLLTGRIDVLARCANSALWISNAIRKDTNVYLMLFPHNITIEIRGDEVQCLNPDERTMALYLQRTLLAGNNINSTQFKLFESNLLRDEKNYDLNGGPTDTCNSHKPGSYTKSQKASFRIARKHREAMIRRIYKMVNETGEPSGFMLHRNDTLQKRLQLLKSGRGGTNPTSTNTFMLDEMGDPLVNVLQSQVIEHNQQVRSENIDDSTKPTADGAKLTTIILGDQIGYSPCDEIMLSENNDVMKVSLGPISLLTSQCITIAHNCLDIQQ